MPDDLTPRTDRSRVLAAAVCVALVIYIAATRDVLAAAMVMAEFAKAILAARSRREPVPRPADVAQRQPKPLTRPLTAIELKVLITIEFEDPPRS